MRPLSDWLSDPEVIAVIHERVWQDVPDDVFVQEMRLLADAVSDMGMVVSDMGMVVEDTDE